MIAQLAPIRHCQEVAGLAAHEIVLGVAPARKHERLLARYRRARRSAAMSRARVVADIRAAMMRGAAKEAADLLIVLRRLLTLASRAAPAPRHGGDRRRIARARAGAMRAPPQRAAGSACGDVIRLADRRAAGLALLSPEGDSSSIFAAAPSQHRGPPGVLIVDKSS